MTSRGSRRLLLSGSELEERGRREAPLLFYYDSSSAFRLATPSLGAAGLSIGRAGAIQAGAFRNLIRLPLAWLRCGPWERLAKESSWQRSSPPSMLGMSRLKGILLHNVIILMMLVV